MAVDISDQEFDELVAEALDTIPERFWDRVDNVVVLVESTPPSDEPDLLGFYDGTPLSERDSWYSGVLPDRVMLFREPLKAMCADRAELAEEIAITVVHEIGHFFGFEDHDLDDLGWG
ncbi:MAG: metallopeptidase family protein [Propionibacteriaceae bacterium]|jgi:predicted Zn-dependent protease with MMP-like domain|nr:metallopeptidase family protein [Propionibacteriaceae bacterium]